MATFFISSPSLDQIHLAKHGVAGTDVLIESRGVEGQPLAYRLLALRGRPHHSRLDLVALRWIGSIGRAANARKLGRAKPRLGAVTADHVGQCADSAAGLIVQLP